MFVVWGAPLFSMQNTTHFMILCHRPSRISSSKPETSSPELTKTTKKKHGNDQETQHATWKTTYKKREWRRSKKTVGKYLEAAQTLLFLFSLPCSSVSSLCEKCTIVFAAGHQDKWTPNTLQTRIRGPKDNFTRDNRAFAILEGGNSGQKQTDYRYVRYALSSAVWLFDLIHRHEDQHLRLSCLVFWVTRRIMLVFW